jgi:diguanylate cyclase (GGDEF)-like protein
MSDLDTIACPLDKSDCIWLSEVEQLRQTVDQLERLTTTDTLTGLFNYRHFLVSIENEMQRTQRSGVATCLMIVDLDHFKQVNDKRGHEAGNEALRTTAEVLKRVTRPVDIICRYGGEEFVIVLPQTELAMAARVAERMRSALEVEPISFDGISFHVTASIGICMYSQNQRITRQQLVDEADGYLYQAKHQGRNRVCHGPIGPQESVTSVSQDEKSALLSAPADSV